MNLLTGHAHDAFTTAYWGVLPSRAREVLRRWRETLPPQRLAEYTFIDVGCGKGRMLLIASELPFRKVVGIELNEDLESRAAKNAEAWRRMGKSRTSIEVLQQDATEMVRPEGHCLFISTIPSDRQ
jgi:tRNA G46 methylase TrmB